MKMVKYVRCLFEDKQIRIYFMFDVFVLAILIAEFVIFKYGLFKIVKYLVLVEALFVIAWKDGREKIILNKHLLIMIVIRLILLICEYVVYPEYVSTILAGSLMGMLIGFLVFGACYLVSRGGMGAGDVKLIAAMGFYLGGSVIMTVMVFTVIASAAYSLVNLAKKKTTLKDEVPFAPFMLVGTILSLLLGV